MKAQSTELDRRRRKRRRVTSAVGLGHELNNPLQNILVTAEEALRILELHQRTGSGDRLLALQLRSKLEAIIADAVRGGRVVRELVEPAAGPSSGRRRVPASKTGPVGLRGERRGPAGGD